MRTLAFKFTLVLVLISLLGIGFTAIYASQITTKEFNRFLININEEEIIENLVDLYQTHGDWDGITQRETRSLMGGPGMSPTVADENGVVVLSGMMNVEGNQLTRKEISQGIPIVVDGDVAGTLILPSMRLLPNMPDVSDFMESINRSLLIGGGIAITAAVIVGLFFSLTLTRRLSRLTSAAKAISEGNLEQSVEIKSRDEIGELGAVFNQMSGDLIRSREQRQQMTADIAHELRTPLSIILGRAETLSEGMLPPTPEVSQIIYSEAQRINRLVEDLRTLSLTDAGELSLELQPVSASNLVREQVDIHQKNAREKDISLFADPLSSQLIIKADPDRIKQVMTNLISNAIRYTPAGGTIRINARQERKGVAISVQDSGSGISEEELPYVFDRFYRGDKARERDSGGTGLGLAIAKSLISAHGGSIKAESKLGSGTVFTFWIPAVF